MAGPLLAGQRQGDDDLVLARLAAGHREEGALGPGPGQQRQETEQEEPGRSIVTGHWAPGDFRCFDARHSVISPRSILRYSYIMYL